ncbi:hypothetical protein ABIC99_003557 [Sphaerotilus sulfidivorans]|uniref:ABC transporter permease n=1 Tax=Sphaerotilus sulfidivorans TaxID=639200 RepID=A0ABV2IT31_9BURK
MKAALGKLERIPLRKAWAQLQVAVQGVVLMV